MVPERPRYVSLAFRSWKGSTQSLVASAIDLVEGTGEYQDKGSRIFWFADPKSPTGYHVVAGAVLLTAVSANHLLATLRSIEQRLNDGKPAAEGGLLEAELLWVEGTKIDTPQLKLPSPLVLNEKWALNTFVATSEDQFTDACEQKREDIGYCRSVAKAFKDPKKGMADFETAPDFWVGGEFKDGQLEGWAYAHAHDEEIFANSIDALLATDAARKLLERQGTAALRHLFDDASDAIHARKVDTVIPIEVALPPGKIEDRVKAWVAAVSERIARDKLLARRAVVFELGPTAARGAIVGARLTSGEATPLVPVERVEVLQGGGAPGEPPSFSVALRVVPPKLPKG
jgi:hypothetical protein